MKKKAPSIAMCDKLVRLAALKKYGEKCAICGKDGGLNVHHIFGRTNRSVRWDLDNLIPLCVYHHVWGKFSAHLSPIEFIEFVKDKRGNEWYKRLRLKATTPTKINRTEIYNQLKELC